MARVPRQTHPAHLAVWDKLQPLFREEIKKGVLDVDPSTPPR